MPRAASDSRSARPSSSTPATPTGAGSPRARGRWRPCFPRLPAAVSSFREAEDEHRRLAADALGVAVDEAVEDVVARHDDPAAGEARNRAPAGGGARHRRALSRIIMSGLEKRRCSIPGSRPQPRLPGRAGHVGPQGLLALLQGPREGGPAGLLDLRVRELVRHPGAAPGRGRSDAVDGDPHPPGRSRSRTSTACPGRTSSSRATTSTCATATAASTAATASPPRSCRSTTSSRFRAAEPRPGRTSSAPASPATSRRATGPRTRPT